MDNNNIKELFDSIIKLEKAMMEHLEAIDTLLELLVNRVQETDKRVDEVTQALETLFNRSNSELILGGELLNAKG